MLEIINEFFSKDSRIRNKTITELLKEYEIEETLFWNYVYSLNPIKVAKIKEENKRRENNNKSLEIYRSLKSGNLTFGEIAHNQNMPIEQVISLLQNSYLNGFMHYSFEAIQSRNTELLKQRQEFQLYFYFLEHEVTFADLGKQFGLEETQIIYFFDSVLDSELTKEQIQTVFSLNKKRERKLKYDQNKQKLCNLFVLTEEEMQSINDLISKFEKISQQQYRARIETLNYIKLYLSSEFIYVTDCCQELGIARNNLFYRLQYLWVKELIAPSILTKLFICDLIEAKRIYKCSDDKFTKIENYMRLYADYLKHPDLDTQELKKTYGIDLSNGRLIDGKLNTDIFEEISDKIKERHQEYEISKAKDKMIEYYKNHFILFRDLGSLFDINQEKLQKYYNSPENKEDWKLICKIDSQRIKQLNANVKKLSSFSNLLDRYNNETQTENCNNNDDLIELLGENLFVTITEKQKSYIDRLIRSILFTCSYIQQDNYDVNELKSIFHIKGHDTVHGYLNHEYVLILLDNEVKEYICTKRKISRFLGERKGQQIFLQNQSYKYNERNEKGQFVKKYQVPETTE